MLLARPGAVGLIESCSGWVGSAPFGSIRFFRVVAIRFDSNRIGSIRFGLNQLGFYQFGSVPSGSVWFHSVRFRSVQVQLVRFGGATAVNNALRRVTQKSRPAPTNYIASSPKKGCRFRLDSCVESVHIVVQ